MWYFLMGLLIGGATGGWWSRRRAVAAAVSAATARANARAEARAGHLILFAGGNRELLRPDGTANLGSFDYDDDEHHDGADDINDAMYRVLRSARPAGDSVRGGDLGVPRAAVGGGVGWPGPVLDQRPGDERLNG